MTENEFVIEDIDNVMGSLRTGIPAELADSMSARLVQLADHFYTVAELLAIPDKEVEALAEKMGVALLNKQVKDAWYAGKGRVFIRGEKMWDTLPPRTHVVRLAYELDAVPTEWRRQLGMLQLLEGRRTLLKDCGYRHDDKVFFLLEAGHGYDT